MAAEKVRIRWKDLRTGEEGQGEPISPLLAYEWVEELRRDEDLRQVIHWTSPVEDEGLASDPEEHSTL